MTGDKKYFFLKIPRVASMSEQSSIEVTLGGKAASPLLCISGRKIWKHMRVNMRTFPDAKVLSFF